MCAMILAGTRIVFSAASGNSTSIASFKKRYFATEFENGEGMRSVFEKEHNADTYGIPYNFYSIMHFAKDTFAKDGTITIETIDKKYQDIIGKQELPTKDDYRKICLMYGCEKCAAENMEE
ncbi:astacin [Ancylostoma duodenale]|uniref:Astacin n=1 Tax=Ancylostoma duodenale TaxID=51022 RepID=A0A0C2BXF6_9BILA|nr:astacin [Ancylostoma duodenale]